VHGTLQRTGDIFNSQTSLDLMNWFLVMASQYFSKQWVYRSRSQLNLFIANRRLLQDYPIPFRWPTNMSQYESGKDITVEQIALHQLLTLGNVTLKILDHFSGHLCSESNMRAEHRCITPTIETNKRFGAFYSHPQGVRFQNDAAFVPTSSGYFNFLTCYSEAHLSLYVYTFPFSIAVWVFILLSFFILSIFVATCTHFTGKRNSFTAALFYSTILEHSFHLAEADEKKTYLRLLAICWLYAGIVISNGYKGVGISLITKPIGKNSLTSFNDIISKLCQGATIESGCEEDIIDFDIIAEPDDSHRGFDNFFQTLLTTDSIDLAMMGFKFPAEIVKFHALSEYKNSSNKLFMLLMKLLGGYKRIRLPMPVKKYITKHFNESISFSDIYAILSTAVEEEVVTCNRSVFVAEEAKINWEYEYLSRNYITKEFFKGKEPILFSLIGWTFNVAGGSKVPIVFKTMVESGIYQQIERIFNNYKAYLRLNYTRKMVSNETQRRVSAIWIGDNIQVIFYALIFGLAFSALAICTEELAASPLVLYHSLQKVCRIGKRIFQRNLKLCISGFHCNCKQKANPLFCFRLLNLSRLFIHSVN